MQNTNVSYEMIPTLYTLSLSLIITASHSIGVHITPGVNTCRLPHSIQVIIESKVNFIKDYQELKNEEYDIFPSCEFNTLGKYSL